jgi:hypothetical protein
MAQRLAHDKLDKALLGAYGWQHDISDEDMVARLLALNLEWAGGQSMTLHRIEETETDG